METLSALDASFLHLEDAVTHMHIGSVGIFEGPAPAPNAVSAAVRRRLALVPRYRQKVRFVPGSAGRPAWVEDPHFSLNYHVRRTAVASPGGADELRNLVGRVMSQQLDRAKPLWELWSVEGLKGGCWALISKVHHCMVDGVSATDLLSVLLDARRDPAPPIPDRWVPGPEPTSAQLVAHALAERVAVPYQGARAAVTAVRAPGRGARDALSVARGLVNLRSVLGAGRSTSLNGPIGPHRVWAWARARLSEIKSIRREYGGTINDVVLAAIAGGFRELLLARGEPVEGRALRTLVPVSVRREDERGTYNNKVSAMFAELPVGVENGVDRLHAISAQMEKLKLSGQAVAAQRLTELSGFAPPMLLAVSARVGTRLPQRSVNTVTTNVPGPQHSLYLCGRRMLEAFPFVPLGGHVRVGVAIFSYDGHINFGVTGDGDTAPDIDRLCNGIERTIGDVVPAHPANTVSAAPHAHRERVTGGAR